MKNFLSSNLILGIYISILITLSQTQNNNLDVLCPQADSQCKCPPSPFRTFDGLCNNVISPNFGRLFEPLRRLLPPDYADGFGSFRRNQRGRPLPNARKISLLINGLPDVPSSHLSVMAPQWGQLIDHEIVFNPAIRNANGQRLACCGADKSNVDCASIDVTGDAFYSRFGVVCLGFSRTQISNRTDLKFREQINQATSFIDGSIFYGSTQAKDQTLRSFQRGQLLNTPSPVPPEDNNGQTGKPLLLLIRDSNLCQGQEKNSTGLCVAAGDPRPNENIGLTILQTIMMRAHNSIADSLADLNVQWSDERIFQETRKILGGIFQHITYNEYLPIILGPETMANFRLTLSNEGYFQGYNPDTDATIISEFATAAYRFGHSLVPISISFLDELYRPVADPILMRDAMLNPLLLFQFSGFNMLDALLRGLITDRAEKFDQILTSELRNHLFELINAQFGLDLAALNAMRGRDHGIPGYIHYRDFCGLSPVRTFDDLVGVIPNITIGIVSRIYEQVEDMDLFTLGVSEFSVRGGTVGPTFACIIARQFANLKVGDAYWYENGKPFRVFTRAQLREIRKITLAKLICTHADNIRTIHPRVMEIPDELKNAFLDCSTLPDIDLGPWKVTSS